MKNQTSHTVAILALFAIAMASRIYNAFSGEHIAWLQNFSPLSAICLCGAIFLPRKLSVILPLGIIFSSDLILNAHYHKPLIAAEMLSRYIALGLVVVLGWAVRKQERPVLALPASVVGSLGFYVITNTGSWISEAGYAKTFAGWVQALTTGLPGYASTWSFFRSTFISDILFTALFLVCMGVTANRSSAAKAPALQPSVS